jgi:acyl-coenzyme A thioesterase PaaI-like protein
MMKYRVLKKQYNSKMCFVCGTENKLGLHTDFYELDNQKLVGILKGIDQHQSYPLRMHGGIITALLDETIGRAIQIASPDAWGITASITVKFLKPVPLDEPLKVVGYVTSNRRLLFEGVGYMCDEQLNILATAEAKYFKKDVSEITDLSLFSKR